MGNLRSVQKAFQKVGCDAIISNDIETIRSASKIVLPGVGTFADGMKHLNELGLINILHEEVIQNKKPFLGICLGMQLLAKYGYENGKNTGLGWIDTQVIKFDFTSLEKSLKTPHVGWNNVCYKSSSILFKDIVNNSDFYFVHSYHIEMNSKYNIQSTDYGYNFVSAIEHNNIFGVQFHPEKSQKAGLQLIKNFINI